jgi:beta-glucosidase
MILDFINRDSLLLDTYNFDSNFFWGMSSSDYNINQKKEKPILLNTQHQFEKTDVSFYKSELEKYKLDIELLKQSGISNFRFSLSWSRIMPDGIGKINTEAINFYNDILSICSENNIEPFVTLFDSCLPEVLENKGGWSNREMLVWFENYVTICVTNFKDKVKFWIVLSDISVFTGATIFLRKFSIGKNGANTFLSAMHHALICQSIGFKTIKKYSKNTEIGIFLSGHYIISNTYSEKDLKAAERIDALLNKAFIEPSLGMGYPIDKLPFFKNLSKFIIKGDNDLIKVDFDFIGLQNCTREIVYHDSFIPFLNAKILHEDKVKNTNLNFQVYDELIYLIIKKYSDYEGVKKIVIVENLVANFDYLDLKGTISNTKKNYIASFLLQIFNATQHGGKLQGCFVSRLNEFDSA